MKISLKIILATAYISIFLSFFSSVTVPDFNTITEFLNNINFRSFLVTGFGFVFCFINPNLIIFYLTYLSAIIPVKIYNLILNKVNSFSKE